jgi:hypothetical protein
MPFRDQSEAGQRLAEIAHSRQSDLLVQEGRNIRERGARMIGFSSL